MKTDRELLLKGFRFLGYTVMLMFSGPIFLYEAFKNQENILFWPVLVIGILLAIAAIAMGFRSVKTMVDAFFGVKKKH